MEDTTKAKASKPKRVVVDEERDVIVPQGLVAVIFRPGESLTDPYKIDLAKANNIALRDK